MNQPQRIAQLVAVLSAAQELCRVALPQFNWGASALSAEAIRLLNVVPGQIDAALNFERGQVPTRAEVIQAAINLRKTLEAEDKPTDEADDIR